MAKSKSSEDDKTTPADYWSLVGLTTVYEPYGDELFLADLAEFAEKQAAALISRRLFPPPRGR